MKKFLSMLLVLALLVIIPVGAEIKYGPNEVENKKAGSATTNEDGTRVVPYTFYIDVTGDEAVPAGDPISVKFTYKDGIKSLECTSVNGYTVETKNAAAGTVTCEYTPEADIAPGNKIAVGGWKLTQLKSGDCSVNYELQGKTVTVNPGTGSSVSYIIVGFGIAAAAVAFAVSRKKSKLYNL